MSQDASFYQRLETLLRMQGTKEKESLEKILRNDLGTPMLSIAILDCGIISSHVIGESAGLDSNTTFQACSISKSLTALATVKLAQDGHLNLDSFISEYLDPVQLSWISTPGTQELVKHITLAMLLSHTSGLGVPFLPGYRADPPTIEQILQGQPPANNAPVRLHSFPGQNFSYSGGGFTVIQLILETVIKKPFENLMQEIVFRPFGMTRTTFLPPASTQTGGANFAPAYLNGNVAADMPYHLMPDAAAAGLWTTPADLMKAVLQVQRSLTSGSFLEVSWAERMIREVHPESGMALGWMNKDGTAFGHTGSNDPGYRSYLMGYTGGERGFCIMTNSQLGDTIKDQLWSAIPYLKGWVAAPHAIDISAAPVPFVDKRKQVDKEARAWIGRWGPWEIVGAEEIGDTRLYIKASRSSVVSLLPAAIPPVTHPEGASYDLVAHPLQVMLRLGWKDGCRAVEAWHNGTRTILRGQETQLGSE
jgi:CubicO group peptidase (beta-lactamase class C family)